MNEVVINGHKFSAIDASAPGRCAGCALRKGFGCALVEARLRGSVVPNCSAYYREDSRDVIFVPKEALILRDAFEACA